MSLKGILDDVIKIKATTRNNATHFALYNSGKIRYLIALEGGKKRLATNLSSYSKKLLILVKMLNIVPFFLLRVGKLGDFVEVELHDEISDYIYTTVQKFYDMEKYRWNMIAGTYDNKQKLVIQCFYQNKPVIYFKVGNQSSDKEMVSEINFLKKESKFHTFDIPKIIESRLISEEHRFNILVTKEFSGDKVEPVLTKDIYEIFQEISTYRYEDVNKNNEEKDGVHYTFSHGDFAPWNLKLNNSRYVVFDWEHNGIRFYGFDLIHYVFQVESLLNGKSKEEAIEIAISTFKEYDKNCVLEKEMLKNLYFEECKKTY